MATAPRLRLRLTATDSDSVLEIGARFSSNGLLLLVCPGAGDGDPIA